MNAKSRLRRIEDELKTKRKLVITAWNWEREGYNSEEEIKQAVAEKHGFKSFDELCEAYDVIFTVIRLYVVSKDENGAIQQKPLDRKWVYCEYFI